MQRDYWLGHYEQVHAKATPWLDYSNDRVQAQTFGLALAAAGPLGGRTCLDVGAGKGQFACALQAFGATVTAIEFVQESVARLASEHPEISWRAGDAGDEKAYEGLSQFDRVFAIEILQYLDFRATIDLLLRRTRPGGGRLVGVMPNAACPVVQKTSARFDGNYVGVQASEIRDCFEQSGLVSQWALRGLGFGEDQSVAPYTESPWSRSTAWERPPNRWLFVADRR